MEEALHDVPLFRDFAGLGGWNDRLPDESTILRFRHLLEEHKLAPDILKTINALLQAKGLLLRAGTVVDATLIAAPSSTKNEGKERDPEMHQSKKGNQWYFGMKAHIGVDADSGLVHTVRGTAGNVGDVVEAASLLHGQETDAFGDAGYQGASKRPDARADVRWHIAMRPGKRAALKEDDPVDVLIDELERVKASIRAKVEHPFRVIKRQFGHVKVRYRGLKKNTAQLFTLFALSNLWMVRSKLLSERA
jgi:IS5 family transposase